MAELWTALQDSSLKAIDRLKVACHLWKHECVTVNEQRRDILIRWACDEVCSTHSKKNKSLPPLEVCCKLWQLLSVMLEATTSSMKPEALSVWNTNIHFFQSMIEVLSCHEDSWVECSLYALKCLHTLLNGSSLPPVLQKYEITASLLEALLKFGMNHIHHDNKLLPSFLPPFKSLIRYYTYLQATQGNQKKVFTTVCTKLLRPVLYLRRELIDNHSGTNDAMQCVDAIIHTLFNRDHLPEFLSAVTAQVDSLQKHKRTAVSYTRVLFETLEQLAMSERIIVVSSISVIYGTFLEENSKEQKLPKNVEFKFFQKILHLLNISIQCDDVAMETEEASCVPSSVLHSILRSFLLNLNCPLTPGCLEENGISVKELTSLSQCLELLNDYNVYQVAEDLASGGEQYSLLKELTAAIMKQLQTQNVTAVFKCLSAILKLNHKQIEPWLPVLWAVVFTSNNQLSMETEQLSRDCISIYSKLRQLPALIERMFEALDLLNRLLPDLQHAIPSSSSLTRTTEEFMGDQLSTLPPGQSVEILETIIKHITSKYCIVHTSSGDDEQTVNRYHLMALLKTATDIARIVLSHISPSTWAGREKDKALLLLQNLSQEVCCSLLIKAANSGFDPTLVSSSLVLVSECCELIIRINAECPQLCLQLDWPVKLVWLGSLQLPIPEQWTTLNDINQLGEMGMFLLKKLSVFHLKFVTNCPVSSSNLLEFILQRRTSIDSQAVWSGQLLDINYHTISVAHWSLILSQLGIFYDHCTTEHLVSIAEGVVSSLVEGGGVGVCRGDGVTVYDVVEQFLTSEGLVEMKELQELMVVECLATSKSILRNILPKPLKKVLKLCVKKGSTNESLATTLQKLLCDSIDKKYHLTDDLPTAKLLPIFKVLRSVALSSLDINLQMKTLVTIVICHVTSVHTLISIVITDHSVQLLEELNYLLAWCLLSITDNKDSSLTTKKKRKAVQRENEKWLNHVLDLLLHWLYTMMTNMTTSPCGREVCLSIGLRDVEVSNLVTMEILISIRMKLGGYPQEFTTLVKISSGLMSEDMLTSAVAEQCLYAITTVTCKTYQMSTVKPTRSELHSSLNHLCEVILRAMELRVERETSAVCSSHPVLLTTMADLLHCIRGEVNDPSRVLKVVTILYENINTQAISVDKEDIYLYYQMLSGMIDLLSLPAVLRPSTLSHDTEEATKEEIDDDVLKLCDLSVVNSWQQLQLVLDSFFEHLNSVSEALYILDCSHSISNMTSSSQTEHINKTLSIKFSKALSLLLTAATSEEIEAIFERLLQMETTSVPSVCVFCYCWHQVLSCKLSQENSRTLRNHLYKVLFACQSIAVHHSSSNLLPVIAAIHLSARLLSVPSQVGLDSGSVLSSLQFVVFVSSTDPNAPFTAVLIEAMTELMLALFRQHLHVAKASTAPVITAVNKLLEVTMKQSLPENSNKEESSLRQLVHCANQLTRIMDAMSRQREFTKFAVYTIHKFVKTSQNQPVHPEVKTSLLSGIFTLLKLCTQKDIAFINASMNTEERDYLQTLIDEHQKFYKFGGKV